MDLQPVFSYYMTISYMSALREKCLYSELFWSAFSSIRTEYRDIRNISPYSAQMRENADQNNSEYQHVLRSAAYFSK